MAKPRDPRQLELPGLEDSSSRGDRQDFSEEHMYSSPPHPRQIPLPGLEERLGCMNPDSSEYFSEEDVHPHTREAWERREADRAYWTHYKPERDALDAERARRTPESWGITRNYLARLPARKLADIHYGMHNVSIDTHMLDAMAEVNGPAEIVRVYENVGALKRPGRHHGKGYSEQFEELYGQVTMGKLHNRSSATVSRHERRAAGVAQRLEEGSKQRFVASFHASYRPSFRESETTGSFGDPGTKTGYLHAIYQNLGGSLNTSG